MVRFWDRVIRIPICGVSRESLASFLGKEVAAKQTEVSGWWRRRLMVSPPFTKGDVTQ